MLLNKPGQKAGAAGPRNALKRLQITPSTAFSETSRPRGKDRQRHALYLTVFWFRLACISKKTVRNTVNLSGY
jgi:hypothetical protein